MPEIGSEPERYDSEAAPGGHGLTSFHVTAKRDGDQYRGYVYGGVTEVFTYTRPISEFPAGIEDFAGITFRRFAERLAALLADQP